MSFGRRDFLQLLGAGAATASLDACTLGPTDEAIVPYVHQSPEVTPGVARAYATSLCLHGYARGVVVTAQVGRPTKIEGNPDHPASLGGTSAFEQATLHDLYSAGRLRDVRENGQATGWSRVDAALARPGPLAVVIEPTTSPSIARLLTLLRAARPDVRVVVPRAPGFSDTRAAFGQALQPIYDFAGLTRLACFAADPSEDGPLAPRYAREIGVSRRSDVGCRIYAVETAPSGIGMLADHRRAVPPSLVPRMLVALAAALGVCDSEPMLADEDLRFVRAMAADLQRARGTALVIVDGEAAPEMHIVAHAINTTLASERVRWIDTPIIFPSNTPTLSGAETILIIGGNPVWSEPHVAEALRRAKTTIYCGLFANATADTCQLVAPLAHDLEHWLDLRAADGTLSVAQPLLQPLFDSRSMLEIIARLVGHHAAPRDIVRDTFTSQALPQSFDAALRLGAVAGTASQPLTVHLDGEQVRASAKAVTTAHDGASLELSLVRDRRIDGGRCIHNPWLLELPQTVTTLTWENAALVSERTAKSLALASEDVVRVSGSSGSIDIPLVVTPAHADGSVTIALGWGQVSAATGAPVGTDARPLLQSRAVQLTKVGVTRLAITQHATQPMREDTTRIAIRGAPPVVTAETTTASLHPRVPKAREQWGMAIDLDSCTGCGACVVACQVENNIPVVGKLGVAKGRIMHWLRIDVLTQPEPRGGPTVVQQPMLCQHCEAAPCEYVCPVNATTHSPDGLNEMTYNRCVGTRFCSNNCPYKVRRFNWFDYTRDTPPVTQLVFNPDVTVRARGVMEKCTFCVQRIRRAGIDARIAGRALGPDEVITACAQACASGAIVFGNIADRRSRVAQLQARSDAYGALADLETRPRVRYLPRRRDLNGEVPA